jgi:two-component system OmpR family sensor kinase
LNARERESLLKTFGISFLSLLVVSIIALLFYNNEQKHVYDAQLLARMQTFSYALEGDAFEVDFIPPAKGEKLSVLQVGDDEVYALFVLPDTERRLKVILPYEIYADGIGGQHRKTLLILALVTAVLLLFSSFFALYALRPLRDALRLMEEFLKDIIHDLNTPVTAITLNTQLLRRRYRDEEIGRIETSAKTIGSLYKNLEALSRELPLEPERVELEPFFAERVAYYRVLYPALTFTVHGGAVSVRLNRDAFTRIVDNLLSNACKYNVPDGTVEIAFNGERVVIRDTGVGIDDTRRAFERFYRESDRGLGMGLNIVRKLSRQMGIGIELKSEKGSGTTAVLTL